MLVSPTSPSTASAQPGGARDPTGRAPGAQSETPASSPPTTPEIAPRALSARAVVQVGAGRETLMASLRARLALPMAELALAGPPPSFKTSHIEELRREMQTPPLERSVAVPGQPPADEGERPGEQHDRGVPGAALARGSSGAERAEASSGAAPDPVPALAKAVGEPSVPRARIDLHL